MRRRDTYGTLMKVEGGQRRLDMDIPQQDLVRECSSDRNPLSRLYWAALEHARLDHLLAESQKRTRARRCSDNCIFTKRVRFETRYPQLRGLGRKRLHDLTYSVSFDDVDAPAPGRHARLPDCEANVLTSLAAYMASRMCAPVASTQTFVMG